MQEIKIGSIIIYYDHLLLILRLKTYKQYNKFKQTMLSDTLLIQNNMLVKFTW